MLTHKEPKEHRMTRRRFTKKWNCMPAEMALDNIKYLQTNYKKYPVYFLSANQIKLGEDIIITQQYDQKTYEPTYTINGLRSDTIGKELKYLWALCTDTATPRDKISHWCAQNVPVFVQVAGYTIGTAAVFSIVAYTAKGIETYEQNRNAKQEQYIQQRIDTAIKEYEATKTIKYNDTTNKKTR
jgi:hypothetical protein